MKKHLLVLLAALPAAVAAQTAPAWKSAVVLPVQPNLTFGPSVASDAAGNVYLAASFRQSVTLAPGTTLTTADQFDQDGVVAKYSPTGSLLWFRQLKGTGTEAFNKVVVSAAGQVTVLGLAGDGATLGTATFSSSGFGSSVALAQLDAQGQITSLREVGSGSLLTPTGMGTDAAGNCYVSGSFALNATFGSFDLTTPTSGTSFALDQFVVKVSGQGKVQWAQQGYRVVLAAGVPTANAFNQLVVAPDGSSCYLLWTAPPAAGSFGSAALPAGKGDYDVVATRFVGGTGAAQWAQRVGGTDADLASPAALDATGRLVVPALTVKAGSLASPSIPIDKQTVGSVSVLNAATGALVWSRTLQATLAAGFRSVVSDAAGNLYVAGHFSGQGTLPGKALTSHGGIDALVVCYAPDGTLRWTQQSGGSGDEIPTTIVLTGSGQPLVQGLFNGSGLFGGVALASSATAGGNLGTPFVATLGSVATATQVAATRPLGLYPNPVTTGGRVTLPALPAGTQLTLLDQLGRVVQQQPTAATLALADVPAGLYVVQALAADGSRWVQPLVVE